MNILILTHSYPDSNNNWRGSFIQEQARALSFVHDITVVYFKVDYSNFAPFSKFSFHRKFDGNIAVYEVTVSKSFPVITQLKYLSNTFTFIKKEIFQHKKIDIIHSHLSYPAGLLGTIIQIRKKIPNILTEHTWIKKYFRSSIHRICVLYALRHTAGLVSVSIALKDDINFFCNRKIYVVPNVVDVKKFAVSRRKKDNILNLGLLGGLGNYRKGLDVLLKAVSMLEQMDFKLHVGGAGIYLEKFIQLSRDLKVYDKCIFYGEIKAEEVMNFYSLLDVYILASRDETFGVVIVEAMACGLPVIATRCGGPQEIITKETGVLADVENPEALARAIKYVSGNLTSYNPDYIREYSLTKYGQEALISNLSKIYREVTG